MLSAPRVSLEGAAIACGVVGGAGLLYTSVVMRRVKRQKDYKPVFEDWLFHTALSLVAYGAVLAAGLTLVHHPSTRRSPSRERSSS